MKMCEKNGIKQSFTRPHTPRTNGKAERVIKTMQDYEATLKRTNKKTAEMAMLLSCLPSVYALAE